MNTKGSWLSKQPKWVVRYGFIALNAAVGAGLIWLFLLWGWSPALAGAILGGVYGSIMLIDSNNDGLSQIHKGISNKWP